MNAQTLYVTGQSDAFRETDAPWIMEERIAASGRSYSVKVYLPEAYTAAHMRRSDETKRLVRWTVRLSDGRCVSREGALRVRAPEVWNRVRSVVAKLRGDRREQAIADALWDALTVEEREAMIAAVDLAAYTVGRSIREASEALHADLIAEMNPLALVAVDWTARFRDLYATAVFGGPVNSPAWHAMTWPQWVAYTYALLGQTAPDAWAPPATILVNMTRRLAPWWPTLTSFALQAPADTAREVVAHFTAMAGGAVDPLEAGEFPPLSRLADRHAVNAMMTARLARMAPAWRTEGSGSVDVARDGVKCLASAARALSR
jgi:hypothetical protein